MTKDKLENAVLNNIIPLNKLWNSLVELVYCVHHDILDYRLNEAKKIFQESIIELLKLK